MPRFHLIHRASQKADLSFSDHRPTVTARQYVILVALQGTKGVSQTELTQITGIDRSTLSSLVVRLQQRGLVRRRRSSADARAYQVRLTHAGEIAVVTNRAAAQNADTKMFSRLGGSELTGFLEQLQRILAD
jgi:DNA-binding MarR family transcriptional regulator